MNNFGSNTKNEVTCNPSQSQPAAEQFPLLVGSDSEHHTEQFPLRPVILDGTEAPCVQRVPRAVSLEQIAEAQVAELARFQGRAPVRR